MEDRRAWEALQGVTHGALAFGHALGVAHHLLSRKGDRKYAAIHAAALTFDAWAAYRHVTETEDTDE